MIKIGVSVRNNLKKEFEAKAKELQHKRAQQLVKALADNTPVDTGEAQQGWRYTGTAIVNEVDHIENLNDGSSKQAPAHFVERTLLSFQDVAPNGTIVRSK